MKVKLIISTIALVLATNVYAMDTSDVENISMEPVDSDVELPDAVKKELMLPETASEKAMEHAQKGLARANEVRGVEMTPPLPPDDGMTNTDDMSAGMEEMAEINEEHAANAAEVVANATARAQEAMANASEMAIDTVANATEAAQSALEAAAGHRPEM